MTPFDKAVLERMAIEAATRAIGERRRALGVLFGPGGIGFRDTRPANMVAVPVDKLKQLQADRDDLLAALVEAVGFHWEDMDYDAEAAQDRCRAVIARIKGRHG